MSELMMENQWTCGAQRSRRSSEQRALAQRCRCKRRVGTVDSCPAGNPVLLPASQPASPRPTRAPTWSSVASRYVSQRVAHRMSDGLYTTS